MKIIWSILLFLSFSVTYGQVTFTSIPLDKQLVGRDINTNLGDVIIEGEVDNLGVTYDAIEVELYRDGVLQSTSTQTQALIYTGNIAPFIFTIPIVAELHNYSIKVYGKLGAALTLEKEVVDIVAGDVYIIQGQSNAVAELYDGSTNANTSNFIRVYASGTSSDDALLANNAWYIGQGDGGNASNGNTGQWGLKLARLLVDAKGIPVAIFNGAVGGQPISYFLTHIDYRLDLGRNYGNLYYRLNKTGLKDKVKAIFWAQGETDGGGEEDTSLIDYKNSFITLQNYWSMDYPNFEKIYIFQTKNGCGSPLHKIKEAQRQLAFEDSNISIMSTAALKHDPSYACHFSFVGGYEEFANRIFPLVDRDIYGGTPTNEIDAPMIQSATLVNPTTLEVVTDAISLTIATVAEDFLLEDASQVDVTNTITTITVSGNKIIFTLSADPGANTTISYLGQPGGVGNFITNANGLEILCFYRYPIVPPVNTSPLLITQYYEGMGDNQWIEVKNISLTPIVADDYNLVLYPDVSTPLGIIDVTIPAPNHSISIGAMTPGQVRLYKNPLASGVGEPTDVCAFDGDDVILISSSVGIDCFDQRIDIVGEVPPLAGSPISWGLDKSFIKGCGTTELPALVFDVTNFIELTNDEVDNADPLTNIALGVHNSGSTTWSTSWDNGTSDRTRTAIISGTYAAIDGSFAACDLTVNGLLDFDGGTTNYIEVSKNLINFGVITIGDQESLYTVDSLNPDIPVIIAGVINKYETTTLLNNSNDFTYWSSPVIGADISTVFSIANTYNQNNLYYWDQSVANTIPGGGTASFGEWISAANLIMESGRGYIATGPEGGAYPMSLGATVLFSGQPNTGEIELIGNQAGAYPYPENAVVFIDNNNPEDDFNLVGNPYPSAIDADLFITQTVNANSIEGTLWFWSHKTPNNGNATGEHYSSDDYASYNLTGGVGTGSGSASASNSAIPTRYIGSGQGFLIQAKSVDQRVIFNDGMRVRSQQNSQFFRGTDTKNTRTTLEKDRIWLNVESSEGGAFNQTLLGFIENATDGIDRAYDGMKLSSGWISLYSKIDTLKYSIQGMSSFNIDRKVPMGFDTYIDDSAVSYKISIDHIEGALNDNEVYLVDNELNVTHDLKQADYNFTVASEGNYPDRFTLQFTKSTLDVDDFVLDNDFVVINEENALLVRSNTVINQIKVYDITGRLLIDQNPKESEFRISTHNIRKGTVLILNTTFKNGAQISKKAINY